MKVTINGESREIIDELSLAELLTKLELPRERVAVELNGEVVSRAEWSNIAIHDNDKLEIVHFVGGG